MSFRSRTRQALGLFALAAACFGVTAFGVPASADDNRQGSEAPAPPRVQFLIPAYWYPAGDNLKHWETMFASAGEVPIVGIATGLGTKANADYVRILEKAAKAGVTMLGYVTTRYGKRPPNDVKAEVDALAHNYPTLKGIFFDEQAPDAAHVAYMADLYRHVRKTRGLRLVISNPGTVCAEGYLSRHTADAICLFERDQPFDRENFPHWLRKYPAKRVAAESYNVPTVEAMRRCIRSAVMRKIGYCYVTDGTWTTGLASYWDDEVAAVRAANRRPAR